MRINLIPLNLRSPSMTPKMVKIQIQGIRVFKLIKTNTNTNTKTNKNSLYIYIYNYKYILMGFYERLEHLNPFVYKNTPMIGTQDPNPPFVTPQIAEKVIFQS